MKIKKRLKDKAGMLVLTAVLVVAALIASVVSGCTEQVKAAENEVSAETSADTDNSSHKETKTTDADKNGSKNAQVSDSDKSAVIKQIKRKLSMPRQIHPAKFMMCLWRQC